MLSRSPPRISVTYPPLSSSPELPDIWTKAEQSCKAESKQELKLPWTRQQLSRSVSTSSAPRTDKVAASLFKKVLKEKNYCEKELKEVKAQHQKLAEQMQEGMDKLKQLEGQVKSQTQLLEEIITKLQEEGNSVGFQKERLEQQLTAEQKENSELLMDKVKLEKLLDAKMTELNNLENRNKAFEGKLKAATEELQNVIEDTKKLESEALLKRLLFEREIQNLTKESDELTKQINQANAEIELLAEDQTALENQLSSVKEEMVSLAHHLEKKEQQFRRHEKLAQKDDEFPPPVGQVTIVFCDIEDGLSLWETLPEVMLISLEIYCKILRDKLKIVKGYEVKSEAECFMLAFWNCTDAIRWCHMVQEALLVADWPERLLTVDKCAERTSSDGRIIFRGPCVRMGVHVGKPECKVNPITGRADYYGPAVNKSSRILGAALGGQVLGSELVLESIQKDPDFMKNVSVTALGKFALRGFQEEETLFQILPKTLAERQFSKASKDQQGEGLSIHEKMTLRRGIYSRAKELSKVEQKEEEVKEGIVREVSKIVKDIEATLEVQELVRKSGEDNPLSQKKAQLLKMVTEAKAELNQLKDSIAELKKEKQNALKQEKYLKEQLAYEVEQKQKLETEVKEHVRVHVEKDLTLDKTLSNIESLIQLQRELEEQILELKKKKSMLVKQCRQRENQGTDITARLNMLKDRNKALEAEFHKVELHKELRGRYLKNLENLVAMSDFLSEPPSPPEPTKKKPNKEFFDSAAKVIRNILGPEKGNMTPRLAERLTEEGPAGLIRKISHLQTTLDQIKMEKELYLNQVETLEESLRKIDEEVMSAGRTNEVETEEMGEQKKKEIGELKERLKVLMHQQSIAQAERDAFMQQLNDLKQFYAQESERKSKALDKVKAEIIALLETQGIIKKLLIQEYKSSRQNSEQDLQMEDTLDLKSLQELQSSVKSKMKVRGDSKVIQIEILGKMLRGESVKEDLSRAGISSRDTKEKDPHLAASPSVKESRAHETSKAQERSSESKEANHGPNGPRSPTKEMKVLGKRIGIAKPPVDLNR